MAYKCRIQSTQTPFGRFLARLRQKKSAQLEESSRSRTRKGRTSSAIHGTDNGTRSGIGSIISRFTYNEMRGEQVSGGKARAERVRSGKTEVREKEEERQ